MIETKNLTKLFDDYAALDNISCYIPSGCIYGMVGSNGAGKSTFLRTITGIYRPDSGKVLYDGQPVYETTETKGRIAFVPDELYFLPNSSLKRMKDLYKSIFPKFEEDRFSYLVNAFGLNPNKNINTFSKGMKRQSAIILALSCHPDYLFFDETFDGLDPVMRNLVKGLICHDVAESNATAIITSHSLRELEDICDQLALLHMGGLILQSDVQNLKTSLFKVQIAFKEPQDIEKMQGLDIRQTTQQGSVYNFIMHGNKEEIVKQLQGLSPILMDVLPLTLEEVFTHEMAALGYSFDDILGKEAK